MHIISEDRISAAAPTVSGHSDGMKNLAAKDGSRPLADISEPSGIHQSILMSCSMRPRSVSRGAEEKHEVHTMINRSIIFTGGESK